MAGEGCREEFIQRGLFGPAGGGEIVFVCVAGGDQAGGLFDDEEVGVDMADDERVGVGQRGEGVGVDADHIPLFDGTGIIQTEVAVDLNAAGGDGLADDGPAGIFQQNAKDGRERLAVLRGENFELLPLFCGHVEKNF